MTFRDWPRTLQPASFRGAHFYVERDEVETGRRLVVHQFPLAEAPYVEDLGREANKITVTAYVVSDAADAEAALLRAACETRGPGRLALPMETFLAHCESAQRAFAKDKLGLVAFTLKFVRDGADAGFALPVGFHVAEIGARALALVAANRQALGLGLKTVGFSSDVAEAAARSVRDAAAAIAEVAGRAGIAGDYGARLARGLADIRRQAAAFAKRGAPAPALTPTSFRAARAGPGAPCLCDALRGVLDDLRLGLSPAAGAAALAELVRYEAPAPAVPPRSARRRQIARNGEVIARALRLIALAAWAEAVAARAFPDRPAAIAARAEAGALVSEALERLAPGPGAAELHRALLDLGGRLAGLISAKIADLAPVIVAENPAPMPALWWANRLYGGADIDIAARAGELCRRNRAFHAAFLPSRLEALAR